MKSLKKVSYNFNGWHLNSKPTAPTTMPPTASNKTPIIVFLLKVLMYQGTSFEKLIANFIKGKSLLECWQLESTLIFLDNSSQLESNACHSEISLPFQKLGFCFLIMVQSCSPFFMLLLKLNIWSNGLKNSVKNMARFESHPAWAALSLQSFKQTKRSFQKVLSLFFFLSKSNWKNSMNFFLIRPEGWSQKMLFSKSMHLTGKN